MIDQPTCDRTRIFSWHSCLSPPLFFTIAMMMFSVAMKGSSALILLSITCQRSELIHGLGLSITPNLITFG